jgi:hypothetical protein
VSFEFNKYSASSHCFLKSTRIADIREEYKKDKQSLREKVLTQTAKIESTLASCSKSLLDNTDHFYDIKEMRLNDFPSHILCIVDHCSLGSKKCICYYYDMYIDFPIFF